MYGEISDIQIPRECGGLLRVFINTISIYSSFTTKVLVFRVVVCVAISDSKVLFDFDFDETVRSEDHTSKGVAFVTFMFPGHALKVHWGEGSCFEGTY